MDPHLFYNAPPPWNSLFVRDPDPTLPARFGRWDVLEWLQNGGVSQQRRDHIAALYDGEVAFVSKALGSLFETLDDLGGNALVVVHTDHGEELFDHGGFEHNHTLYDELVRAGLWVSPPGGLAAPVRSDAAVSLADIAPTLYDYAGFDDVPEMDGASLRPLVEGHGSDWPDRALPVGFLMYAQELWGVVHRGHKYIARSSDGREELYDLAADPHEQADLAASADLAPFRAALVEAHGVDAGPGWRLVLTGRDPTPIEVVLPAPAVHAGVLDPESVSEHRANQVWGEVAAVRAEEVATIALSDDRRTLTVVPAGADGVVMVTFDAEHRVAGEARCGDETRALSGERWVGRHGVLDVAAGFVVWPPVGEAARMAAIEGRLGDVTDEERAVLVELGYLKR